MDIVQQHDFTAIGLVDRAFADRVGVAITPVENDDIPQGNTHTVRAGCLHDVVIVCAVRRAQPAWCRTRARLHGLGILRNLSMHTSWAAQGEVHVRRSMIADGVARIDDATCCIRQGMHHRGLHEKRCPRLFGVERIQNPVGRRLRAIVES